VSSELLELAIAAARQAGKVILGHHQKIGPTQLKRDGSPLTPADLAAHRVIIATLGVGCIPVVSEESSDFLMSAESYWLVDPLDGKKNYLSTNDEFTFNIALIEGRYPIFGVVFAPALDELYAGGPLIGSWCDKHGVGTLCRPARKSVECRMAISRFHDHPDVDVFAAANGLVNRIAMGSALNYGRLAAAQVDVFSRLVSSSEWDTAAGQAVLEGTSGRVLAWGTGKPLGYCKPRRRNPRLLSFRAPYSYTDFILHKYDAGIL
jgi:3'(2'), 5'-bisphosphate nucleotidase